VSDIPKNVKDDLITNIRTVIKNSFNTAGLMNRINELGTLLTNIPNLLSTSNSENSTPMKETVTINGILYTSLINPKSNSIDHLLLNIKTANYGIMNSFNDVDDMFARIKLGKELKKERTYDFKRNLQFNKKQRVSPSSEGGRPKNTRIKKRTRRSKRYNKTKKVKRKKYI